MARRFAFGGSNKNTIIIAVVVLVAVWWFFLREKAEASSFGAISIPWLLPKSCFGAPMSNWTIAQAGSNAVSCLIVNSDGNTFNKVISNLTSIMMMPESRSTAPATSR